MKREIIVPLDNEFYDTSDPEPKEKLFSEVCLYIILIVFNLLLVALVVVY